MLETLDSTIIVALISFAGTFLGSYSGFVLMKYRLEEVEKDVEDIKKEVVQIPLLEQKILYLERGRK